MLKIRFIAVLVIAVAAAVLTGCSSPRLSEPSRTAFEQLLLSNAADRALADIEIPQVAGRSVFVDPAYLSAYDQEYLLGSIRAKLSVEGALLVNDRETADLIVEPRSGALGIDSSSSIFGIPAFPIAVPGVGTMESPEVALYKSEKADSISKILLLAYENESGENVFATESLIGKSYHHHYTVLAFISFRLTDIPEYKKSVMGKDL